MKHHVFCKFIALSALMLFATTGDAHAASKLGDVFTNTVASFSNFTNLAALFAYVSGVFLAAQGIFKFKAHVDNANQTPLSDGVKRFLAGGMFLALPYMSSIVVGTLNGAALMPKIGVTSRHGLVAGGGLDKMVMDLMQNAAQPFVHVLSAFCYISATFLLVVGISRLTKSMQEGPRGPAGIGTIMTFISAGMLFSAPSMIGAMSSTLFGNATVSTFAIISTTVISAADAAKIAPVIEAVMGFVMIVGIIAFIRGWFVLRAFADGQSGASLAQGLTFLFGGALAINLGKLINVLGNTVGVTGLQFG